MTPPEAIYTCQDISPTCCGRWRSWWTTDGSSGIIPTLDSQAVTALLPQVVQSLSGCSFKAQGNLQPFVGAGETEWSNGRLHLDQGSLASQAVTALLPQVREPLLVRFKFSSEISNLLWALAKLVDNGRFQRDRDAA